MHQYTAWISLLSSSLLALLPDDTAAADATVGANQKDLVIHLIRNSAGPDPQGVLGETRPDAPLDAVVQYLAVEVVEGFRGEGYVLELDETHGAVLFGSEAESLVATLQGEDGLEFLLRCVDGQVANVERIAGRNRVLEVYGNRST